MLVQCSTAQTEDLECRQFTSSQKSSVSARAHGEPAPHTTKARPHWEVPVNSEASHNNLHLRWCASHHPHLSVH